MSTLRNHCKIIQTKMGLITREDSPSYSIGDAVQVIKEWNSSKREEIQSVKIIREILHVLMPSEELQVHIVIILSDKKYKNLFMGLKLPQFTFSSTLIAIFRDKTYTEDKTRGYFSI